MPFSTAILAAEGDAAGDWAGVGWVPAFAGTTASFSAGFTAAVALALPSVSMTAITSPLVTLSPSFFTIFTSTPSAGAGSSSTTLSVSTSIRFSSRFTGSPAFLRQATSVASETDSDSWGTFTSTCMICPWFHLVRRA